MDGQTELKGLSGQLRWREEAGRVRFQAETEARRDGLYKVYLLCENGELALGTLTPEGEKLALCRSLSRTELERAGCREIRGAEARLAFSFGQEGQAEGWQAGTDLGGLLRDPVLAPLADRLAGALTRRGPSGTWLAVPFSTEEPFPLVPLICLGEYMEWRGRRYLRFSFDAAGRPRQGSRNPFSPSA